MTPSRLKAIYVLDSRSMELAYGPDERADIAALVDVIAEPLSAKELAERPGLLADVEVIFSSWGAPVMDAAFLDRAPNLKAVFYAAGAIGYWTSEAVWQRGVVVSSAAYANGIPVTEYTLAMIIMGLKGAFPMARATRQQRRFSRIDSPAGAYRSTVGLVSLGVIARRLLEMIRVLDVNVIVCDPFLSADEAERLRVTRVSLETLFATSDVVSLHTPLLPETVGMVRADHFAAMKPGATFINTARGGLVVESDLVATATKRPDLQFMLDVTSPEPPVADSPLYDLPNVFLTPHIAGSLGQECRRMGRYMVDELRRFIAGQPLQWSVSREAAQSSAHRPMH